jgi:HEAT repeat protein
VGITPTEDQHLTRFTAHAVPDLFTALEREPHGDVRAWIARTLFFLVDGDDVGGWIERLSHALRDSEPTVRTWIVNLLARAGPVAALAMEALTDCLDLANYALRQSAQRALESIAQVSGKDGTNMMPSQGDPGGGAG